MHQYIDRQTLRVCDETLRGDAILRRLYSPVLETVPGLLGLATSRRVSQILAFLNYDNRFLAGITGTRRFAEACGIDMTESVEPSALDTPRRVFERKIRYWDLRPLPPEADAIVCPADSRVVVGSSSSSSLVFIKGKFFEVAELLGGRPKWVQRFLTSGYALFRLTPEKYHWTHFPVSGRVVDFYDADGVYHSCNPAALVRPITPLSKNRRVITVIDTNVENGSNVGMVAMIEIVALMIGHIEQRYCESRYEHPQPVEPGMFVHRGCPKGLFRPGSSSVVLLFEPGRVQFATDLVANRNRADVNSRLSEGLGRPVVETDVQVRSLLALPTLRNLPSTGAVSHD